MSLFKYFRLRTFSSILFLLMISSYAFSQNSSLQKVVILGDSLTEGYGVEKDKAYPALLEKILNKNKVRVEVVNSGISGSTTASAYERTKWILKSKPDMIIIALGANDGLRGVNVKSSSDNLSKAIELIQKENKNIKIIIAGILLPFNYGEKFRKDFEKIFPALVKKYKTGHIPFLLKDVGAVKKYNLADGIHPNEAGHEIIAKNVAPIIERFL